MLSNLKSSRYIFIVIFVLGLMVRIYPAFVHPLWLDEIYSIYFASNFSVYKILFNLPESHPGLFYILLKAILSLTTSTFFLRLISGIVPQAITLFLLNKKYKNNYLNIIFALNPLFIHHSWQIRMYSLVILLSVLIFDEIRKKNNLCGLLFYIFIANLISYSFILPTIAIALYLYKNNYRFYGIILGFLPIIEFFIFKGSYYKTFSEFASWISTPRITSISPTFLTHLGLYNDINSQANFSLIISVLLNILIVYLIVKLSSSTKFFYLYTLPLSLTVIISILFPILSQRFFFYQFIPKISLWLPRFLLPLSVTFYLLVSRLGVFKRFALIFLLIYVPINININLHSPYPSKNVSLPENILFLPPWENLFLPPKYSTNDINNMVYKYNLAEKIEKDLLKQRPECIKINQNLKYIDQSLPALSQYQEQLKTSLNNCLLNFPGNQ